MKRLYIKQKEIFIYTMKDLAAKLGLTPSGVLYRVRNNALPAPDVLHGSKLFYSQEDFLKLSEEEEKEEETVTK